MPPGGRAVELTGNHQQAVADLLRTETATGETGFDSTSDDANGGDAKSDLTIDFAFVPQVTVGNLVFRDMNASGKYESTIDLPASGVVLQLFNSGTTTAAIQTGSATYIATTTTDAQGRYSFTTAPGSYFLYAPASNFAVGSTLYFTANNGTALSNYSLDRKSVV